MVKKICVVGAGKWGKNHIRNLDEMNCLSGIVEKDKIKWNSLKDKYPDVSLYDNLEESFKSQYDGYVIATPAGSHYDLAIKLIQKNKNILIEKPMALNTYEAVNINREARKHQCKVMVGHVLLFHPAIQKIKELILNGKIGKLQYIYSNRLNLGTVRTEENVFWSFAPHDISIFQYFTESYPIRINSSGGCFLQSNIHDITMTILDYPENIKAHIFVSWLHPFKEHRIIIIGSKGMIFYEDSSPDKNITFYQKGIEWREGIPVKKEGPTELVHYDRSEPLRNELEYFIDQLDSKILINNEKQGLEVVEILEKATTSLMKSE